MPLFPKFSDFESDPRVDFLDELGKWVFTDEDDGLEYEYDNERGAWFPMWNDALIESQQSVYATEESPALPGIDNTQASAAATSKEVRKRKREQMKAEKRAKRLEAKPADVKPPTKSIYIQGLPLDVSVDELAQVFGRFGLIMEDFNTKQPKIKLYRDLKGRIKGDALLTYFKEESVALAITLQDDAPFRADDHTRIRVSEAEFKGKPNTTSATDKAPHRKTKIDPAKRKQRLQQMEKKLTWFESDEPEVSEKYKRIVILKHMFTPDEIERDPVLLLDLKEDIRSEVEKLGPVTNLKLYEQSSEGVVSVKYADKACAEACVQLMDGRWFGGQQIVATIYDGKTRYEQPGQNESEDQTASRLEKFGDWLENDSPKET
ncbi:hypothetical protein H4R35_002039 [Dimargaris xerosporica]|nr:hypothetical protein H4R35_002039 [Dimargaris xerosporica]